MISAGCDVHLRRRLFLLLLLRWLLRCYSGDWRRLRGNRRRLRGSRSGLRRRRCRLRSSWRLLCSSWRGLLSSRSGLCGNRSDLRRRRGLWRRLLLRRWPLPGRPVHPALGVVNREILRRLERLLDKLLQLAPEEPPADFRTGARGEQLGRRMPLRAQLLAVVQVFSQLRALAAVICAPVDFRDTLLGQPLRCSLLRRRRYGHRAQRVESNYPYSCLFDVSDNNGTSGQLCEASGTAAAPPPHNSSLLENLDAYSTVGSVSHGAPEELRPRQRLHRRHGFLACAGDRLASVSVWAAEGGARRKGSQRGLWTAARRVRSSDDGKTRVRATSSTPRKPGSARHTCLNRQH